jgi:site-specific recombinase XerD
MRDPDLKNIKIKDIDWYLSELQRLGWKNNGRNLVAIALRSFFDWCNLREYANLNYLAIQIPERDCAIPRVCDFETFAKLINLIPKRSNRPYHIRDLALLLLLWDTGARVGEIVSLNADDIDFENTTALIKTEKSRGRRPIRQIFWREETNEVLKKWFEKRNHLKNLFKFLDDEALFLSISRTKFIDTRGRRLTVRNVNEIFRVLSHRAGLDYIVNPHSLRHSMGRDSIQALRDPISTSNILGHSHPDSSAIYEMIWGPRLKEDWNKVMRKRGNPLAWLKIRSKKLSTVDKGR